MNQSRVPNWKLSYQRQEQEEGIQLSSHLNNQQHNPTYVLPLSNYEVAELTWEKGQLAMHAHGGIPPTAYKKGTLDTLESIVHQATCHTQNPNLAQNDQNPPNMRTIVSSSSGKCGQMDHSFAKKRTRSEPDQCGINFSSGTRGESIGRSAGAGIDASGSATFGKSIDRTAMTWPSFESPQSLKTKKIDEDYGSENQDEEGKTRGEIVRSHPTRRSRSASVHNQSERRRRDRINQKMKALQKLVPNSNKTDKASMLDEAIEYLKKLQAQVQMMSIRNMPQVMVPLAIQQQQQLQMSMLARMGMGVGLSMAHPPAVAAPFVVPHMIPTHNPSQPSPPQATINASVPFNNPYSAFLAQSMNVDLYNKMAAAYLQQQVNQATSSTSQSNHVKEE